jgi:hypothetical protein
MKRQEIPRQCRQELKGMTMMKPALYVETRSHIHYHRRSRPVLQDRKECGMVGAPGTLVGRVAAGAARQQREDVQPIWEASKLLEFSNIE